jgi:hypothetical protein
MLLKRRIPPDSNWVIANFTPEDAMQVSSISSQVKSNSIQAVKPKVQPAKPQTTGKVDADGDHDGDTARSDKGGVDTKG